MIIKIPNLSIVGNSIVLSENKTLQYDQIPVGKLAICIRTGTFFNPNWGTYQKVSDEVIQKLSEKVFRRPLGDSPLFVFKWPDDFAHTEPVEIFRLVKKIYDGPKHS